MLGSSQWMYSSGKSFYDYEIEQSLRFEDGDSPYLYKTPSSTDSQKKWTLSFWMKRGNLGIASPGILSVGTTDGAEDTIILTADRLRYRFSSGSDNTPDVMLRDPSAWYHVVLAVDTTQSTAKNRLKWYLNGVYLDLDTVGYYSDHNNLPAQNHNFRINSTNQHYIGEFPRPNYHFDGHLAEWHFIDGTQYDADDFGETKSGIWVPKEFTGSYGTAGYRLDFADSSNLGNDVSGNNNDYTSSGLAASDVVLDSPTNNFATFNPLDNLNTSLFSEGNLKVGNTTGSHTQKTRSTFAVEHNFYFEVHRVDGGSQNFNVGVATATANINSTSNTGVYTKNYGGGAGDILMFAYSADANALWTGLNGTWDNSATVSEIEAGTTTNATHTSILSEPIAAVFIDQASSYSGRIIANFGQDGTFAGTETAQGNSDDNGNGDFYYQPPSGFLSLCSDSLPSPAIDPLEDETPEDYFKTVLYTGNGTDNRAVSVGWQPDFVWIKGRSNAYNHRAYDVIRGATKSVLTDTAGAEQTHTDSLKSFTSDGFTLGTRTDQNNNNSTFVSWNWVAGGTGVSNTDGTITTTVSANTKAGFSIVKYTGNASGTIGHGLGVTPDFFIIKNLDQGTYNWNAWHNSFTAGQVIYPNLSNARNSDTAVWNNTLPTSSVISVDNVEVNNSGDEHIAYVFANKDGYFKTGTYTGNGSSDGVFVHTGFRVAWYMIKRLDTTSEWNIVDNQRNQYEQPLARELRMNLSNAESYSVTYRAVDFLSNGFKLRTSDADHNASGGTYLYVAFAKQPFKYANAR